MQNALLENVGEVVRRRDHGVIFGQLVEINSTSLHRGENHGRARKQVCSVSLHEIRGGRADGHNQIGWPLAI